MQDSEFAAFQEKLNEQINKMNEAIEKSHGQLLTDEETREMKKLYRSIVKSLHPDMNPDLSEAQVRLFHNAIEAYGNGDLDGLRIISEMISEPALADKKSNGVAFLIKEKERLGKLLQTIKDRIIEIKSKYPYNMLSFL